MEGAFKLPLISRNSKWVSKSVKFLKNRAHKISSKRFHFDGMVVNNSVYCASPPSNCYLEAKMEDLLVNENESEGKVGSFVDLNNEEESGESISSSSNFLPSEVTLNDENSSCGESFSPPSFVCEKVEEPNLDNRRLEKQGSSLYVSEIDMMKERFAKLLLGEDMSGCGNGVCTALAISNAITNLCASLFGQVWRLEPLPTEKELMWRREMEWLLSVSDHIVELVPLWQTFPDGTKLEIMTSRPRSDLYANLPALRKLDNMLLEILDSFEGSDFWYVDQGMVAPEADGSSSFQKPLPCQENKWWLPVPQVSPGGLSEGSRKMLQNKRDSTNQILKAAMAINSAALAEMDVPDSYFESLPKNGRASLGDLMYRYINSDQFSPECLLGCLDLSSEHQASEIANRVESSIYVWRRRTNPKPLYGTSRSNSKSSWEMVKDLVADADRRELLADRAESLLLCLKQRFPGLPQTTLDTSKIQCNKDVGKSILESYSRVLESLAFNIVARIDDLLYVDDLSKQSDQLMTISKAALVTNNTVGVALPLSATPYKTAFSTPSFSPLQLSKGDSKFRVKNILTDYPSVDGKGKKLGNGTRRLDSFSSSTGEMSPSPSIKSSSGSSKETISPRTHDATGDQ